MSDLIISEKENNNNNLKIFNFGDFNVRTFLDENGNIWFCLKDISIILDIKNHRDIVSRLDAKGVDTIDTLTKGGVQKLLFVNEPNLYRVIFQSRKENAVDFQNWIVEIVIPSIRKTGQYGLQNLTKLQILEMALDSEKKLIASQKLLEEQKPKVEFYDDVTGSKDAIDIGSVAKLLNYKELGRNRLFEFLRNKEVLMNNNQPYQKYVDSGYFRIIEQKYNKPDGSVHVNLKTVVYQSGVDFIRKLVKKYRLDKK